jgi:cytochrome c peroxidase
VTMRSRFAVRTAALLLCSAALVADRRGPPRGLDLFRPVPADNPLTLQKVKLGRQLFNERRLSKDGSLSCAGCHDPGRAFTDGRPVARGVGGAIGTRNAPTIVNRAWGQRFFWDGRAGTLEAQVLEPLLNRQELGQTPSAVVALARSDQYGPLFVRAFGAEPTLFEVARALATYVRTILAADSPFDRYAEGDRRALSPAAESGLLLFRGKARCTGCHVGPLLSDEQFHNTGVAWRTPAISAGSEQAGDFADLGRFVVTGKDEDRGAFKTPTLREVARTAPYMHDGSLATLDAVVDFYSDGGRKNPRIDAEIHPLQLVVEEKQALVAFLNALSGSISEGQP